MTNSSDQIANSHLPLIAGESGTVAAMNADIELRALNQRLLAKLVEHKYSYNFTWYGRPIIQLPSDIMAMQMLILHHQPDLIIETGVAHGGSLVFYASMMQLIGRGRVVGIDIDIRPHNRRAITEHPLAHRIDLIEGSSLAPEVIERAASCARAAERVFVCLDSNHTAQHVYDELKAYSPMVSVGAYVVVFDTIVDDQPAGLGGARPWGPGNGPMTAVHRFLGGTSEFAVDRELEARLLHTFNPDGYLRRVAPAGVSRG